jgi:2,3,4,5-tetrahydropyridine-2,6-dicarboxylate N-succinyltransferase
VKELEQEIARLFRNPPQEGYSREDFRIFDEFKDALNRGEVRAAARRDSTWTVNLWVKQGILLGFKMGSLKNFSVDDNFRFFDKHTFPLKRLTIDDGVRVVPGGSSIRDGVHMGKGVTCMPPMYINAGAFVDDGTMIDSHAQIGGVLEPVGALPVIVEDDVLIGGNCGVYEGTIIREGAVLGAGTILTGGTPVYDLVRKTLYRRQDDRPLEIPAQAVVVPGTRAVADGWGKEQQLSIYTPIIVKYRDSKTESRIQLEDLLR